MKKLLLLFFLLGSDIVRVPIIYCQNHIEQVSDDRAPILDLEDDAMPSGDEEMLEILNQEPQDPSIVWTWVCTIGSSLVANCIHAQQYISRFMGRMKMRLKRRLAHN